MPPRFSRATGGRKLQGHPGRLTGHSEGDMLPRDLETGKAASWEPEGQCVPAGKAGAKQEAPGLVSEICCLWARVFQDRFLGGPRQVAVLPYPPCPAPASRGLG